MELIPKRYETIADIPADKFLPLQKNTEEERSQKNSLKDFFERIIGRER